MYGDRVPRHLFALVTRPYRLRNRTKVVPVDRELTADERRLLRRIEYNPPYANKVRVCAFLDVDLHLSIMRARFSRSLHSRKSAESTMDPHACTQAHRTF